MVCLIYNTDSTGYHLIMLAQDVMNYPGNYLTITGKIHIWQLKVNPATTVNVHIFAQPNLHASSIRRHIRAVKFSRIYQLILFVLL